MSEYTPLTESVRNCYVYSYQQPDGTLAIPERAAIASFDRWLESVKAEVRAEQIEADIEAVERIKHHHRPSDFGSGWWRSMVDDAVEAIRAQLGRHPSELLKDASDARPRPHLMTRDDLIDLFEKHADRIDGELVIPISTAADLIADHTHLLGDRNDI